jgi:hypothetical protein
MSSCKSCEGPNTQITCPSRMHDARVFTDYRPRCAVNAELFSMVNKGGMVQSSYESRMFLQRNAEKVMDSNRTNAVKNLAPCAPCNRPFNTPGTMLPERFAVKCNGVSCTRTEVNPNGLGDGRTYQTF